MPFDFRMKHEGEPPARLVASLRTGLKQLKLPPQLAEVLAPVMKSDDDLLEVESALVAAINMAKTHGADMGEALTVILDALREHIAAANEDDPEEDEEELTAWFDDGSRSSEKETFSARVYGKLKGRNRPKARINGHGPRVNRMGGTSAPVARQIEDALLARMDRRHKPTIGAHFVDLTLGQYAGALARQNGLRPRNDREALRIMMSGGHTTSDSPRIFGNSLGKMVAREMEQSPPAILRAAHHISASDYYPGKMVGLSASGMPEKVLESGEIRHVTIDESGETKPVPDTFAAIFRASQKTFVQDDLGVLTQIGTKMSQGAAERQRRVLLNALEDNGGLGSLMSDTKPVFHADHGNIANNGTSLDVTSLGEARLALRTQKGAKGEIYTIEPWALVVPPALETVAQQVLAEIDATKVGDVNPFGGQLELIVEPGLADPDAWYLIGDPGRHDGLAWSSLYGEGPRVESNPGWETLGMDFRLVWDLDARFVSWHSWFKNPGT